MDESGSVIISVSAHKHRSLFSNKGEDMADLSKGDMAPDFELRRDGGGEIRLSDLRGAPVVLFFYPKDDTETCTAEAIAFSNMRGEFADAGAALIGISPDSVKRHDRFKAKHGISVDLASDEGRQTLENYGVWTEKSMYGRKYMGVARTTFLIGADGLIREVWRNVRVRGHAEAVLVAVGAL
jgi:thioredoxin-dependent peroxiredoxin